MNMQPEEGDVVLVRYNPNSPEDAILDKDNTWIITMIFWNSMYSSCSSIYNTT